MEIRNVTEFRNFVDGHGLRNINGDVDAVAICVMDYERGCSCWQGNERQMVYNNCKALYVKAMSTIQTKLASQFLSKAPGHRIVFYQDGIPIGSVG